MASTAHDNVIGGEKITNISLLSSVIQVQTSSHCSGFMIAATYAITARHCQAQRGSTVFVRETKCVVTEVITPLDATESFDQSDFVILKINCANKLNLELVPFELPDQDEGSDQTVQLAGFGRTCLTCDDSNTPLQVSGIITNDYDLIQTKSIQEIQTYTPNLLKAARGGLNLCVLESLGHIEYYGDSGGPVYSQSSNGFKVWSVNSVMLSGNGSDNTLETVYGMCGPRLSHYTDWIKKQISPLLDASSVL